MVTLQFNGNSTLTSKLLLSCQEFEREIKQWCKEAGEDVTYEFAQVGALKLSTLFYNCYWFVPVVK